MERVVSLKQNVGIIFQQIANDETCVARFCTCVKDIFNWISTPDEAKPVFVWLDRYQTELLLAWDPVTIKPGMEVIYPGLRLLEYLFFLMMVSSCSKSFGGFPQSFKDMARTQFVLQYLC